MDERAVTDRLAQAEIITYLGVTRAAIKEAPQQLRHERQQQTNLAGILGATRFKIRVNGRAYRAKCPKAQCYAKDSFGRMLDCYSLQQEVLYGSKVVPFLVKMAKVALPTTGRPRIPNMGRYHTEFPRKISSDPERMDEQENEEV